MSQKRPGVSIKEACIHAKEPCMSATEPDISAKEPCMSQTHTHTHTCFIAGSFATYRALLRRYRALLRTYRALLRVYRPLLWRHRVCLRTQRALGRGRQTSTKYTIHEYANTEGSFANTIHIVQEFLGIFNGFFADTDGSFVDMMEYGQKK